MPNRQLYNVQGLFFLPYSGEPETTGILNHRVLKRVNNVQTLEYSINQNTIDLYGFGKKTSIFNGVVGSPGVEFSFSYIPDGLTNENRLNFDVSHFQSTVQKPMFFSLCSNSVIYNNRDFYVVVNTKNSNDLFSDSDLNLLSMTTSSGGASDIIDPISKNYSILHFQNCYLTNYSFSISVGELSSIRQSYSADNIIFYASGSGIKHSTLDPVSGTQNVNQNTIVVPKYINPNLPGVSGFNLLMPGDASLTFLTKNTTGVLFHNDTITSLNLDLPFNRKSLRGLNYKFPLDKPIQFPVNGSLEIGLLIKEDLSGSFFQTLDREEEYNIVLDFKSNRYDINPTKFTFSGCKFNDINYSSSIGEAKTAILNFNIDLDTDFNTKGIFASGNVLYATGINNTTKKILMY